MKNQILPLFLIVLLFNSCQKDEEIKSWTASGSVMMESDEIESPVENISVYLAEYPFETDTVKSWIDKNFIVDSTVTDAEGNYSFSIMTEGSYAVVPFDTVAGYNFTWDETSDSPEIVANQSKSDFTINFLSPEPVVENGFLDSYRFRFTNGEESTTGTKHEIKAYRTCRVDYVFWYGDWYWDERDTYSNQDFWAVFYDWYSFVFSDPVDASGGSYEYRDQFHFKFFIDGNWVHTMHVSGDDLPDPDWINEYKVDWYSNSVQITKQ